MNSIRKLVIYLIIFIILFFFGCGKPLKVNTLESLKPEISYYGVEIDGQLCGYSEVQISQTIRNNKRVIKEQLNILFMLTMLGSQVNTIIDTISYSDPESKRCEYAKTYMKKGEKELAVKFYKKSLELNPKNTNAVKMLKKIQ